MVCSIERAAPTTSTISRSESRVSHPEAVPNASVALAHPATNWQVLTSILRS